MSPPPAGAPGWRSWLPRVLVESTLIVFSVLLALGLDQWQQGREHRRLAGAATREIVAELRMNRAAVDEAHRYHRALMDTLAAHRRAGTEPSAALFSRGFIAPAQVTRTAWESAAETGALSHVPYEQVLKLSAAYAQQDRYAEQARSVGQIIYAELLRGGFEGIAANHRNLGAIVAAFRYREEHLVRLYDETFAALGG
jgi:hypothetical protein